jgi:hypothetical protein
MSEESRPLCPPDSSDDPRGPASRGTAQRQNTPVLSLLKYHSYCKVPVVFSAHQFRAFRSETLKLVKLAIMDFESSDRLKFAHCSYLLLLPQDVGHLAAPPNAGHQLRRAISIQAEGKKLLGETCRAVSCKALLCAASHVCMPIQLENPITRMIHSLRRPQLTIHSATRDPLLHPRRPQGFVPSPSRSCFL